MPIRRALRLLGPGRMLAVAVLLALVASAAVPGWLPYRIRAGDTLWGLARSHHTTVSAIERANHLGGSTIYAGALLLLPGSEGAAAGGGTAPDRASVYVVRPGDTVTAIADRFTTSVAAVVAANHLSGADLIDVGQRLVVPRAGPVTTGRAVAVATAGGQPGQGAVVALIRRTAAELGVPADLALGIAEQESGFQQQVRSPTGAVGVMQVEPATAAWLSQVSGRTLQPAVLTDNVYAGVLLLHLLLAATNQRTAIAAYYQGLGSVQRRGMLTSTRQYVDDVLALAARMR
jgi:LysM repeat protein